MRRVLLFICAVLLNTTYSQWQFIGLNNRTVHSITQVNGVLFAGTDNQVFKSTDDGTTWTTTTTPNQFYTEYWVESVDNTLIAYANGAGSYSSTDLGTTWTVRAQTPSQFNFIKSIGNNLFAGHQFGLFKSTNGAVSWDQITIGTDFDARGIAVNGDDIWSCSWSSGLYHSTNNGQNWTNITAGIASQKFDDIAIINNVILAATRDDKGINRSTDNGQTWSVVNSDWTVSNFFVYGNNIFAAKFGMGSTRGPVRSTDNGLTWTYANEGLQFNPVYFFKFKIIFLEVVKLAKGFTEGTFLIGVFQM